jgi:hypothetical protein
MENAFNRTAERLGYGPNAIMHRILALLRFMHNPACQESSVLSVSHRTALDFASLLSEAVSIASELCPECQSPYLMNSNPSSDVNLVLLTQKMVRYLNHNMVDTQKIAIYYVYILAIMSSSVRDMLVLDAGAVPAVEALKLFATSETWMRQEMYELEEPARMILQALQLQANVSWFSLFNLRDRRHPAALRRLRNVEHAELLSLVQIARFVVAYDTRHSSADSLS